MKTQGSSSSSSSSSSMFITSVKLYSLEDHVGAKTQGPRAPRLYILNTNKSLYRDPAVAAYRRDVIAVPEGCKGNGGDVS